MKSFFNLPPVQTEQLPPVDDLAILREYNASQQRVVDENLPAGYIRPMSCTSAYAVEAAGAAITVRELEDTVLQLERDKVAIAVRLIELERGAAIMRAHLEALTLRLAEFYDRAGGSL